MQLRAGMSLLSPGGRLALRRPAVAPRAAAAAAAVRSSRALLGTTAKQTAGDGSRFEMPFKSVLAANRGEIAVRIMRAGNELGLRTVGIFSKEDRFTQHRCGARLSCVLATQVQLCLERNKVNSSRRVPQRHACCACFGPGCMCSDGTCCKLPPSVSSALWHTPASGTCPISFPCSKIHCRTWFARQHQLSTDPGLIDV